MDRIPSEPESNREGLGQSVRISYQLPDRTLIEPLLQRVDELRTQIDTLRPLKEDLWNTIGQKLRIAWTYHSNAIEGSTLTLGETDFFLRYGLTSEGKPFDDFLEARNHAEAIDYLNEVISSDRPLSEGLLKELNALLLDGVKSTPAINVLGQRVRKPARPGQYKSQPNHVLQPDGTIHHYVEPLQVSAQMAELVYWINEQMREGQPVCTAALAHYNLVRIHPFDDGNGRCARLLMNLILMRHGYPPTVIYQENRRRYIEALTEADRGNTALFVQFVAESVLQTQEVIVADLTT